MHHASVRPGGEELEGDPVGVAERDAGPVVRVDDAAVGDAELVQPAAQSCNSLRSRQPKETWSRPVCSSSNLSPAPGVGVQAEELAAADHVDRVVEAAGSSSSSRTGSASNSALYHRVLRSRSVTVTATWANAGNSDTTTSGMTDRTGCPLVRLRLVPTRRGPPSPSRAPGSSGATPYVRRTRSPTYRLAVSGRLAVPPYARLVGLVERDTELAALQAQWARARAGSGGFVLVMAESGGGKTSLVNEFARSRRRAGAGSLGRLRPACHPPAARSAARRPRRARSRTRVLLEGAVRRTRSTSASMTISAPTRGSWSSTTCTGQTRAPSTC